MNIRSETRRLTFLGVMLAVTFILSVTPIGFVPLGSVSATIVHVPTIITGIVLGPLYGLVMGTFMGIISLFNALTRPVTALDPLFINPLVSVLPRMAIGVVAYYTYSLTKKIAGSKKVGQTISAAVGGIFGSMTNTILVLSMLYIIYVKDLMQMYGIDTTGGIRAMLFTIITTNAVLEAIVAGVITTAIVVTYFAVNKSNLIKK
ncbi:ECF transporter S component [Vallitaleaceae bacterium 9-2]